MTPWWTMALAARMATGTRKTELDALLRYRGRPPERPDVIVATPKRFLSLRKLTKPNAAIDAMLRIFHNSFAICESRGLSCRLDLSDRPSPAHAPALYLSHHTIDSPAFAALRAGGAKVLHFKAADLPARTCVDPMGFAGWSSLADTPLDTLDLGGADDAEVEAYFESAKNDALSRNISKYDQSSTAEALPERFVFVALQTIGDMVQRNAYVPMLDMLDMLVRRFDGSGMTVVVKRHPKCRSRRISAALRKIETAPHVQISQGSIHQLVAAAEAVFTVNSGVGSESLVYEVPLYCFGKADYAAAAHQIRSEPELLAKTDPISSSCSPAQRKRFIYHYRNIYQIRHDDELKPRLEALILAAAGQAPR